jgi:hypothetical protein
MEAPTIKHMLKDPVAKVTYEVLAYRKLTDEEVVGTIRTYLAITPKKKRPKKGQQVTILTVHR